MRWSGALVRVPGRPRKTRSTEAAARDVVGRKTRVAAGAASFEVDVAVGPGRVVIRRRCNLEHGGVPQTRAHAGCGSWVCGKQLHQRGRAGVQCLRFVAGTRPCHLPQARAATSAALRCTPLRSCHHSSSSHRAHQQAPAGRARQARQARQGPDRAPRLFSSRSRF